MNLLDRAGSPLSLCRKLQPIDHSASVHGCTPCCVVKVLRSCNCPACGVLYAGLCGATDRQELFMALWTLKEAVVKAKGTGINAAPGLKGFSVGKAAATQHA